MLLFVIVLLLTCLRRRVKRRAGQGSRGVAGGSGCWWWLQRCRAGSGRPAGGTDDDAVVDCPVGSELYGSADQLVADGAEFP